MIKDVLIDEEQLKLAVEASIGLSDNDENTEDAMSAVRKRILKEARIYQNEGFPSRTLYIGGSIVIIFKRVFSIEDDGFLPDTIAANIFVAPGNGVNNNTTYSYSVEYVNEPVGEFFTTEQLDLN